MRRTGPRVPPASLEHAAHRLGVIDREMRQILRAFPDLRQRSRTVPRYLAILTRHRTAFPVFVRPLPGERLH